MEEKTLIMLEIQVVSEQRDRVVSRLKLAERSIEDLSIKLAGIEARRQRGEWVDMEYFRKARRRRGSERQVAYSLGEEVVALKTRLASLRARLRDFYEESDMRRFYEIAEKRLDKQTFEDLCDELRRSALEVRQMEVGQ